MCISNDISDDKKKQYIQFLISQVEQKAKQVENSTKLYFQSLFILGASIAIAITALAQKDHWADTVSKIFIFGVPFFLIAWFGCFLFIYWEHHMLRISLDFSEKKVAEALHISPNETYLYHEDFLGIFNQSYFLSPKFKIKAVQVVFIIIGLPAAIAYGYFVVYEAKKYLDIFSWYWYWLYCIGMILIAVALVFIHWRCVHKERRLKNKLNIVSKVELL
jgi:hypothetical protein